MRVLFIRHAESENNLQLGIPKDQYYLIRNPDPRITEKGRTQTQLLGHFLLKKKLKLKKLYCSAMVRAMETASILQKILQVDLEIKVNTHEVGGLYKVTKGEPGKNREWISENYPNLIVPDEVTEEGWYRRDDKETRPEGVERARLLIEEIKEWAKETDEKNGEWIGFVTHGNFMDALLAVLLERKEDSKLKLIHVNTGITGFEFNNDGSTRMLYVNASEHLEEDIFCLTIEETQETPKAGNAVDFGLGGLNEGKNEQGEESQINVAKKSTLPPMYKQDTCLLDDESPKAKNDVPEFTNPE